MIKAVATALVLIAGAAVILWYGNTLNSWVLGGLIGGLAAILLSIPISLTLFSFFARRHDEQRQFEETVLVEEELFVAQQNGYILPHGYDDCEDWGDQPELYDDDDGFEGSSHRFHTYDDAEYEDILIEAKEEYYSPRSRRNLPEDDDLEFRTYSQRSLPAPSSRSFESNRTRGSKHNIPYNQNHEASRVGQERKKGEGPRTRHTTNIGSIAPGYPANPQQSHYHSEALRMARKEAAQQAAFDELYNDPPPTPHRYGARIHRSSSTYHNKQDGFRLPQRPTTPASTKHNRQHSQRVVDSFPPQSPQSTSFPEDDDEYLYQDDWGENYENPTDEDFHKPLVRRAPYTYADDPIRQAMNRHAEHPEVRRSSRTLRRRSDNSTT